MFLDCHQHMDGADVPSATLKLPRDTCCEAQRPTMYAGGRKRIVSSTTASRKRSDLQPAIGLLGGDIVEHVCGNMRSMHPS